MDEEILRRRKRVKNIKRAIIFLIIAIILLPTILCIVLFIKMNGYKNEVEDLKSTVDKYVKAQEIRIIAEADVDEPQTQSPKEKEPSVDEETSAETTVIEEKTEPETEPTPEVETEPVENVVTTLSQAEQVEQAVAEGRKVVYFTFDDGPSGNTLNLLDVLDKYDVKVTFFVNARLGLEDSLKEIVKRGHTIAIHTYSHDYNSVYKSLDSFIDEVLSDQEYIYENTGVRTYFFRFPGGSSNTVSKISVQSCIDYLDENGFTYFDWNASCGDGGSTLLTKEQIYDNVMKGIEANDVSIVLMHDASERLTTYEAMDRILSDLIAMDALILPITEDTVPVHHNISN